LDLRAKLGNKTISGDGFRQKIEVSTFPDYNDLELEAPPGFEPGMEVLQSQTGPFCRA